jgi:aryl-alcohol dehydrogenase-like predicted oxidoreductase
MTPFYDEPDFAAAVETLQRAREIGVDFLDTSDAYGQGKNEELIAYAINGHRDDYVIATKFGNLGIATGVPSSDGRPEYVGACCEKSLKRLQTEIIDLYYIHRIDPTVPIEDTVGAMSDLVRQGKVRHLGICEAGAATIRRAHATHPLPLYRSSIRYGPAMSRPRSCHSARSSASALSPTARSAAAS